MTVDEKRRLTTGAFAQCPRGRSITLYVDYARSRPSSDALQSTKRSGLLSEDVKNVDEMGDLRWFSLRKLENVRLDRLGRSSTAMGRPRCF